MNIFRLAAELFLVYILYKLIVEFIIPIFQSTHQIRKQFGEMQSKMQQDLKNMNSVNKNTHQEQKVKREGDYIEFEEIKK